MRQVVQGPPPTILSISELPWEPLQERCGRKGGIEGGARQQRSCILTARLQGSAEVPCAATAWAALDRMAKRTSGHEHRYPAVFSQDRDRHGGQVLRVRVALRTQGLRVAKFLLTRTDQAPASLQREGRSAGHTRAGSGARGAKPGVEFPFAFSENVRQQQSAPTPFWDHGIGPKTFQPMETHVAVQRSAAADVWLTSPFQAAHLMSLGRRRDPRA